MSKQEQQVAAVASAVRIALEQVGLKRLQNEEFFGLNQPMKMPQKLAA